MTNIPIYRAKKQNSDKYAEGYYFHQEWTGDYPNEDAEEREEKIKHFICGFTTHDIWDDEEGHFKFMGINEIDPTTLEISFDNGKSFIKLSDLEIHTCTDFELKYTNMKMRDCKELQPPNGSIFTVVTDKGR